MATATQTTTQTAKTLTKMYSTNSLVKLSVGIDISKDKFNACLRFRSANGQVVTLSSKEFSNRKGGFDALLSWVRRLTPKGYADLAPIFVMEATGVYYENLAFYLDEKGQQVSVQLASNVKHFGGSYNKKSKTDAIDARIMAQMGIERSLDLWEKPLPFWRQMRGLCRERVALLEEKTMIGNQLHAIKAAHEGNEKTIARLEKRIDLIKNQVKEIEDELRQNVKKDPEVAEKIANVCTIKGVELVTAVTVVSECDGFANFHSKGQLVSYAGYDVVKIESGDIKKKPHISKKGNRFIRRAMHFPAQCAIQRTQEFKDYANRIIDTTKIKMKGAVAIQRKLLVLIYKLFTKNEPFQENYQAQKQGGKPAKNTIPLPNEANT